MLDFQDDFIHGTPMPKITLTPQQNSALESAIKKRVMFGSAIALKAVLLSSEGWSVSSIAQALRKSEFTVNRHLNDYLQKDKLRP